MEYASQHNVNTSVAHPAVVGSISGGLVGAGALGLAIIGLAGVYPQLLLSIAVIAAGAAFLIEGSEVSSRFSRLMNEEGSASGGTEISSGMNANIFGGIAGVTLGILALIGFVPEILSAIAVIAFGATLMSASGTTSRIASLIYAPEQRIGRIAQEAANSAVAMDVLAGVAAIALGVLALIGISTLALNLIGVLVVGAALLLSGSSIGARIAGVFNH
ncbi:MAG: hypothetical protein GX640_05635 [Fibrobacter sp.]|nr:hypothetical protein [Fibrobacter sp.]